MIRGPPRSTLDRATAASDVYKRQAREGIEGLNRRYASDRPGIFYLFHRPRRWNEVEGVWMGYERKRGKLAEFNAVLRGGSGGRHRPRE